MSRRDAIPRGANVRRDTRILAAMDRLDNHRDIIGALGNVEIAGRWHPALEYLDWAFARAGRGRWLRAAALLDRLLLAAERHRAAVNDDIIRHERDGRTTDIQVSSYLTTAYPAETLLARPQRTHLYQGRFVAP